MNKKTYQSPTLKVVEFKVERGFESSFILQTQTNNFEMEFFEMGTPKNEMYNTQEYDMNYWN